LQEYYANTGALKRAAMNARDGKNVGCSIVETFGKSVKPRELEEVLRLEYRSKLLNPKWAQVRHSCGSVFYILLHASAWQIRYTCRLRVFLTCVFLSDISKFANKMKM
jgi:hypothetical protein